MATANWLPARDREAPSTLDRSWRLRHTGSADDSRRRRARQAPPSGSRREKSQSSGRAGAPRGVPPPTALELLLVSPGGAVDRRVGLRLPATEDERRSH